MKLFIDNKYTIWYFSIINNAKIRIKPDCYTEKHHIIPRCMNGDNFKENLVVLTAREHFICHWLLIKMTNNKHYVQKLTYALYYMAFDKRNKKSRYIVPSRTYEKLKEKFHKNHSDFMKGKFIGENNPFYGKHHSEDTKQILREHHKEQFKDPWQRNMRSKSTTKQMKKKWHDPSWQKKMTKSYTVYFADGSTESIRNLVGWCRTHGIPRDTLRFTLPQYRNKPVSRGKSKGMYIRENKT